MLRLSLLLFCRDRFSYSNCHEVWHNEYLLQEKETHGYKISEVEDNVEYDHEEEWMSETDLVLFKVNLEDLKINAKESGTILSFNKARFKNYKNLLRQGRELISEKEYDQALFSLGQARKIDETAEVVTLIGWCYSLMGKFKKGKRVLFVGG